MKYLLYLIVLISIAIRADAQIISTAAGNGTAGSSGMGGPATAAAIDVWGVACDRHGNVYISDFNNDCIRKVNTAGIISVFCGAVGVAGFSGDGGPAIAAKLNNPGGAAVDSADNIFFSDNINRIRKINAAGVINTIAGTGTSGYGGEGVSAITSPLQGAGQISVDRYGNIYFAELNRIRKINSAGIMTTLAGGATGGFGGDGGPATAALLNAPSKVVVDNSGNLYIADKSNYRVRKVDATGIITTIAGTGALGFSGDGGPAIYANIANIESITIDGSGNIYICDGTCRVRKIVPAGIISTVTGTGTFAYSGDGGLAIHGRIGLATGLDMQGDGDLYIADFGNNVVRLVHDRPVQFIAGHSQTISICGPELLNDSLAVSDADTGQHLVWNMVTPPAHGTASASYTHDVTGAVITPTGLMYAPLTGYVGWDTFSVRVYDGMRADTAIVYISVYPTSAGIIIGPDTLCVGYSVTDTNSLTGGVWSASNGNATVSTTGVVTGVSEGWVVISYTISNPCINASSIKLMYVGPPTATCVTAVPYFPPGQQLAIYPNPNDGSFTINSAKDATVRIGDMTGKTIKILNIDAGKALRVQLDVPTGIYLLSLQTADGGVVNEKISVVR